MTFEEQVEEIRQALVGLTIEQKVRFAWQCSIRALPFLGFEGHFSFWKTINRQEYLYSIFNALDVSNRIIALNKDFANKVTVKMKAVASIKPAHYYSVAQLSALYVAAAISAIELSAAHSATYSVYATNYQKHNLKSVLLQDIKDIKANCVSQLSTNIYGEVWDNFQLALEKEGCAYWGKLYADIFANNFEVDIEALKRRLAVPPEIQEQGAAAVAAFLEDLETRGSEDLNEARIIILGDKGVGKTCIARRLENPYAPMTEPEESTAGVDTILWKLEEEQVKVRIWDFAGHTVTHAVHQFFLSARCLYIMVYNGRTEEKDRLDYWLRQMKTYGENSQAFVLVNKRDQHRSDISIRNLEEKYNIAGLHIFDIGTDKEELAKFRKAVSDYIVNHASWRKQVIPKSYYLVKKDLELLFDKTKEQKGKEYIDKDVFMSLADKHDLDDKDKERLLRDLHDLGVCLWYKDMEDYETLVLNPEWISHGVYSIINWTFGAKTYTLTLGCFEKVFEKDALRYPTKKCEFLFNLMRHYELAYETSKKKKGKKRRLVIPHLLPEDRIEHLPSFEPTTSLEMQYEFNEALPAHSISRFIVRHHTEIQVLKKKSSVWRYGVVLDDGKGNIALVREIDRSIKVWVKGTDATAYISAIRKSLNGILESYKNAQPNLKYRIVGDDGKLEQDIVLSERSIVNHVQHNELFYDDVRNRKMDMLATIKTYGIIAKGDIHIHFGGGTFITGNKSKNQIAETITNNTFNFEKCQLELQGDVNNLVRKLKRKGHTEEAEDLEELLELLEEWEEAKGKEEKTTEEVKKEIVKKGIWSKLKSFAQDLGDEDSKLNKGLAGLTRGKELAKKVYEHIPKIAEFLDKTGFPTDVF